MIRIRRIWFVVLWVVAWLGAAATVGIVSILYDPTGFRFAWANDMTILALPLIFLFVVFLGRLSLESGESGPAGKDLEHLLETKRQGKLVVNGEQPRRRAVDISRHVPNDRRSAQPVSSPSDAVLDRLVKWKHDTTLPVESPDY